MGQNKQRIRLFLQMTPYCIAVVLPVLLFLTPLFFSGVIPVRWADRTTVLFLRSILFSVVTAAGALGVSMLVVPSFLRLPHKARSGATAFLLVLAAIPPYVHALAWLWFLGILNSLLGVAGNGGGPVSGWLTASWVEILAYLPLSALMVWLGYSAADPQCIAAGRMVSGERRVFWKIIVPLAAPGFCVAAAVVFLLSLMDYSVPSLFQVTVYTMEIFSDFSASNRADEALRLSVPLMAVAIPAIVLMTGSFRKLAVSAGRNDGGWSRFTEILPGAQLLQKAALMVLTVQLAMPIVSLIALAGSPAVFGQSVMDSLSELGFTLMISAMAAVVGACIAWPAAEAMASGGNRLLWVPLMLPLVLPAPIVGIGLIALFNHSGMEWLWHTPILPVLVGIIRFSPFAVLILYARLVRQDRELIQAARILSRSSLVTLFQIRIPLMFPALFAAAAMLFILTGTELGAMLMVVPPGHSTLSIKIYNYLHYGASSAVAGLCLVNGMITAGAGFAAVLLLKRR